MAQKVDKSLSKVLGQLKNATNKDQCRRVKLIGYFLGLNWSDMDKPGICIPDIYFLLSKHSELSSKATAVLQSMLQMVGVDTDTVAKLGSTKKQLEECKQLPKFAFAEMIMNVVTALGDKEFKDLRSWFIGDLDKTHPDNIETPEDLFRRLYHACKVDPKNVEPLREALNQINLNLVAGIVREYQDQHGQSVAGTPASEQATGNGNVKLTLQAECHLETTQPEERSQLLVAPQLNTHSASINHDGRDTAGDTPNDPTHTSPTHPTVFAGLGDDEKDRASATELDDSHTKKPLPLKDDKKGVGMSIQSNNHSQPSRSTSTSQPSDNDNPKQNPCLSCRSKCSTPTFVCCVLVFALLVTTIVAGPGDLVVYLKMSQQLQKQVVLGHDNDTIIVGKVTGLFVGKVNISEHLEENDYSHISRIYVTHSLKHCKRELKGGRALTYQPDHTQFAGLLDYIYLLEGSEISYTMCVASVTESSDGRDRNFYIFDDLMDYRDYSTDRAVYHHVLQVGTNNRTVCWPLKSWVVSKTGYYFIMSETPGNIVYEYRYNIQQVYLDSNDYNEAIKECPEGVYEPYSCVVHVKRGDYVLAYVVLPVAADPMTTHLRLQPMSLSVVKIVMIVAVCVFGVCFLAFFVCLMYTINRWYNERRRYTNNGYMRVTS